VCRAQSDRSNATARAAFSTQKKVPGPTGDQWFVAPVALPKLIGDLQQWQMQRAGHGQTRPAATEHDTPEKSHTNNVDTPGLGRPEQATADKLCIGTHECPRHSALSTHLSAAAHARSADRKLRKYKR